MSFPASYDAIPRPSASDSMSATQVQHNVLHDSASDSISAIQYTVGITNSTATNTHDYKISALSALAMSGQRITVSSVTANFTANATALYRTSGVLTGVLPAASGVGTVYYFKNLSGTTLLSASGANTIDGNATYLMNITNQSITLCDVSAAWNIL